MIEPSLFLKARVFVCARPKGWLTRVDSSSLDFHTIIDLFNSAAPNALL